MSRSEGSVADEVRAKRFVLVDDSGAERATLESTAHGVARLTLHAVGEESASVALAAGVERGLMVSDRSGAIRLSAALAADGSPSFTLYNSDGAVVANVSTAGGNPSMALGWPGSPYQVALLCGAEGAAIGVHKSGKELASLSVGPEGPVLDVVDPDSKVRILSQHPGGTVIQLFGGGDRAPLVVGLGPNGLPAIQMFDALGKPRAIFGLGLDGKPLIGLLNEKGEVAKSLDTSSLF